MMKFNRQKCSNIFWIWAGIGSIFFVIWGFTFLHLATLENVTPIALSARSPIAFGTLIFISGPLVWIAICIVLVGILCSNILPFLFT